MPSLLPDAGPMAPGQSLLAPVVLPRMEAEGRDHPVCGGSTRRSRMGLRRPHKSLREGNVQPGTATRDARCISRGGDNGEGVGSYQQENKNALALVLLAMLI